MALFTDIFFSPQKVILVLFKCFKHQLGDFVATSGHFLDPLVDVNFLLPRKLVTFSLLGENWH